MLAKLGVSSRAAPAAQAVAQGLVAPWPRRAMPEALRHAAFLTRAAGANNVAVFAQYIALLGSVEDDVAECFEKGGGVPYAKFPRFHAVMAEDSGLSVGSSLESHILPLVSGLADRLRKGMRVLDVGCGSGPRTFVSATDASRQYCPRLGDGQRPPTHARQRVGDRRT